MTVVTIHVVGKVTTMSIARMILVAFSEFLDGFIPWNNINNTTSWGGGSGSWYQWRP